jgi:hypothetical protein
LPIGNLFVALIDYSTFVMFAGERFTGDSIFTFNPPAEIDELAALRTEGTKGIVFPVDRPTAGWAFHDLEATKTSQTSTKEMPVV